MQVRRIDSRESWMEFKSNYKPRIQVRWALTSLNQELSKSKSKSKQTKTENKTIYFLISTQTLLLFIFFSPLVLNYFILLPPLFICLNLHFCVVFLRIAICNSWGLECMLLCIPTNLTRQLIWPYNVWVSEERIISF